MNPAYISWLLSSIKVDIFGRGNKILPKSEDAFQWISENYKFYLAFENSNCRDYITEKAPRNALMYALFWLLINLEIYYSTLDNEK